MYMTFKTRSSPKNMDCKGFSYFFHQISLLTNKLLIKSQGISGTKFHVDKKVELFGFVLCSLKSFVFTRAPRKFKSTQAPRWKNSVFSIQLCWMNGSCTWSGISVFQFFIHSLARLRQQNNLVMFRKQNYSVRFRIKDLNLDQNTGKPNFTLVNIF